MLRLLALLLAVVAVDAHAQTLTLTYERVERGLSPATLMLEDAPAIRSLGLLTDDGTLVLVTDFERDGDELRARTVAPPAGDLSILLIDEADGGASAWWIEEGSAEGYTKVEWTELVIFTQGGEPQRATGDECDFSGCPLTAIRNPYTCECIEDIRDPYEVRASRESLRIQLD